MAGRPLRQTTRATAKGQVDYRLMSAIASTPTYSFNRVRKQSSRTRIVRDSTRGESEPSVRWSIALVGLIAAGASTTVVVMRGLTIRGGRRDRAAMEKRPG